MKKESKAEKVGITPLGDRVLIREEKPEEKETKTKSGIIIPVTVGEDKGAKRGVVIAVGSGRHEDGKWIPMNLKGGETVLFQWGDKIVIDSEEYFLVRENEVLAIVK